MIRLARAQVGTTRIHRNLDTAITHELRARWPGTMRLKQLRLAVKGRLAHLMRMPVAG